MVELIIKALIWLAIVVGLCWLVVFALGELGIILPAIIIKIGILIIVLIAILVLYKALKAAGAPWLP